MQEAPPKPPAAPPAPAEARCRVCGTPHEAGQEFCLDCGSRLTPHYRRPPSWRLVASVAAAAVLLLGAGVGAAIGLSGGHDKTPVQTTLTTQGAAAPAPAPTAPTTPSTPTTSTPNAAPTTPTKPETKTTPPQSGGTPGPTPGKPKGQPKKISGLATWPLTKTAYTADLFESPSPQEATKKAKAAVKKGIPAGVLFSDFYKTLPSGLYVVFAGQYRTSQEATAAANSYAGKGFGAAYARLIQPKQ